MFRRPKLVSLKDAAGQLGFSVGWLRKLVARQGLAHCRPGGPAGRIFFTEEQVAQLIARGIGGQG